VFVVAVVDGAFHGEETRAANRFRLQDSAFQGVFDGARTPRFGRDAAQRHADIADRPAVRLELQADGGAGGSERVGLAVAALEIGRALRGRRAGNGDGGDDFARLD